jgi:hypothetical protein
MKRPAFAVNGFEIVGAEIGANHLSDATLTGGNGALGTAH